MRTPCLLASLVVVAAACRHAPPAEEAETPTTVRVRCVAPEVRRLARRVTLRGTVEIAPGFHTAVAPQVPGRLLSVAVREGDRVRRGAVLATVDARAAQDAVVQAQAALAGATAAQQSAAAAAQRTHALLDHGIASRQEDEDAAARLAAARAQATAARASLDLATRTVSFATVRAPQDGVVLRALRAPGDLVDGTPATPVLEIGDPSRLEMLASAAPADLVQLSAGQPGEATFEALPGRHDAVTVRAIAPSIDANTGVGSVRLAFATSASGPPIGLAGEVRIDVGAQDGVRMIPATALRGTPAGGSEVLVCEAGHVHAREVQLGARDGERVEVREGLAGDARVVSSGVLGLADGAPFTEAP